MVGIKTSTYKLSCWARISFVLLHYVATSLSSAIISAAIYTLPESFVFVPLWQPNQRQEILVRVSHYISVLEAKVNSIRCHGPVATAGETDVCSDAVNLETQFSHWRTVWRGPFLSPPTGEAVEPLKSFFWCSALTSVRRLASNWFHSRPCDAETHGRVWK